MNAPLVPSVDQTLWNKSIENQLAPMVPKVEAAIKAEQDFYNSPEQVEIRNASEKWYDRSNLLREASDAQMRLWHTGEKVDDDYERYLKRLSEQNPSLAESVNTPEFQRDLRVFSALENVNPRGSNNITDTIGERPQLDFDALRDQQKLIRAANDLDKTGLGYMPAILKSGLDETRNAYSGGITGAAPTTEGRVYLNPANLGANVDRRQGPSFNRRSESLLFDIGGRTPNDVLLQAAADAKIAEGYNKALPGIKQAIRTGVGATTDLTGAVPLFDPEFRQAVEQGNARKAARQIATEYAIGAASAPVVGAGMGVLQRVAPQAARVAAGGLGLARTANPVAVVSQLGGSARITPKVAAAETAQVKEQIKRAQAARARGGRWKFPTPFGALTIPELGISESGGLFFP